MILHVLPLEGLSEVYINSIRMLGKDERNVFVVSSTRSAVIKFHPVMMAVRRLIFLAEPKSSDKKKKQMTKEMQMLISKADTVFWHTAFSTNSRYILDFMSDTSVAAKSVWVQTEREFEKVKKCDQSLLNAMLHFRNVVFTSPLSQPRYQEICPGHEYSASVIDIPNTVVLGNEWLEIRKQYQFGHSGLNAQIGFTPVFKNYLHIYNDVLPYLENRFHLCIVPYNMTNLKKLTAKDEKYIGDISKKIAGMEDGVELSVLRFERAPDSLSRFEMIQRMDCICFPVNPPYGSDFLYLALLMGKYIFFEQKSYYDYFTEKGITVFMLDQIPDVTDDMLRTPIASNCENEWLNSRLEFRYAADQWQPIIERFSGRAEQ